MGKVCVCCLVEEVVDAVSIDPHPSGSCPRPAAIKNNIFHHSENPGVVGSENVQKGTFCISDPEAFFLMPELKKSVKTVKKIQHLFHRFIIF